MKRSLKFSKKLLLLVPVLFFLSCENNVEVEPLDPLEPVELELITSSDELEKIANLGFSTQNVYAIQHEEHGQGYLVEGDIVLYDHNFNPTQGTTLNIAQTEQYRTTLFPEFGAEFTTRDRRTGEIRTVRRREQLVVVVDFDLPVIYFTALEEVARRYNAVGGLTFTLFVARETDPNLTCPRPRTPNADIRIRRGAGNFLAAAGFPFERDIFSRNGTFIRTEVVPFNDIRVNVAAIGNEGVDHLATILSHEIGHCIGFRHTDYFNRRFSCGVEFDQFGNPTNPNEDIQFPNDLGAVQIPGTPSTEDANSFMLACIGDGVNRPINQNDRIALRFLFSF